ncbi:carboxypeptidase-like regulatory domain-containing protein [Streptomyces lasalocidi]
MSRKRRSGRRPRRRRSSASAETGVRTAPQAALPAVGASRAGASRVAVVRGQVRDGAGVPVPRAAITLLDTSGHQLARALSREDGSYAVDTSERGSLVLIGSAAGHRPQVVTLNMNNAPVTHDLVLRPSPAAAWPARCAAGTPKSCPAHWWWSPTSTVR